VIFNDHLIRCKFTAEYIGEKNESRSIFDADINHEFTVGDPM